VLSVRLLGPFAVEVDGRTVPPGAWGRRDASGLVKLLALRPGRRLHREQVMDLMWPDLGLAEAAPRLHKAAHYTRRALGSADAPRAPRQRRRPAARRAGDRGRR
jgi:DNA-binding SARP family transcriptional activator